MKKMKKWLGVCLALALVVGLIPANALAAESLSQPTRTEKLDFSTMETTDRLSTEGWKWEKGSGENTLTLENFYLKTDTTRGVITFPGGGQTTNIVLKGTNKVEQNRVEFNPMIVTSDNAVGTTLIISGDGSIEFKQPVETETTDQALSYVFAGRDLVIRSGTVKSNTDMAQTQGSITVEGGRVEIRAPQSTAPYGRPHGLHATGDLNITGGVIDIVTDYAALVSTSGNVNLANADITAKAKDAAIQAINGNINITGGTVDARAEQFGLSANRGDVNVTGGTVSAATDATGFASYAAKKTNITNDAAFHASGNYGIYTSHLNINTTGKVDVYGESIAVCSMAAGADIKVQKTGEGSSFTVSETSQFNPLYAQGTATVALAPASYAKVDAAISAANALERAHYEDFTGVDAAISGVVRDYHIMKQDQVDAMAKAINDAVAALVYKPADYTAVDAAITAAGALKKADYKEFATVEAAVAAVDRTKNITEQDQVDAMAKTIRDAISALERKPVEYQMLEGAGSAWEQGSDGSLAFRASGEFAKFTGVKVDGTLVDPSNYTAKSGSTIITFRPEYLRTLGEGNHTMTVLFTDGQCAADFAVSARGDANADHVPQTGEEGTVLWMSTAVLACAGAYLMLRKKKEA